MTGPVKAVAILVDVKEGFAGHKEFSKIERYGGHNVRAKAGWTSVRIDKHTAEQLRELARQLPTSIGLRRPLKLVELFSLLARAGVELQYGPDPELVRMQTPRPRKKHARASSAVHAKSGRGKRTPPILKEIERLKKAGGRT